MLGFPFKSLSIQILNYNTGIVPGNIVGCDTMAALQFSIVFICIKRLLKRSQASVCTVGTENSENFFDLKEKN